MPRLGDCCACGTCPSVRFPERRGRGSRGPWRLLRPWIWGCSAALAGFGASACDSGATYGSTATEPEDTAENQPAEAEIRLDTSYQRIAGFGASSAWTAPALDDELADLFFSEELGLGFSLLRVRITPAGETDEVVTAQKAMARGARVWASPWSPPGEWKSNGSDTDGGTLLPDYYGDWAERLAGFARSMADQGIPLSLLSVQNEPNWVAEWETCEWLPADLVGFVRDHLGPALGAVGVDTRVIAPETNSWGSARQYADPLLDDSAARSYLGAVATHSYGGGSPFAYTELTNAGLEFWQTEYTDEGPDDRGMGSGINVARAVHEHLTVAGVSAWHYWWLLPVSPTSNSALFIEGQMTRRGYVLGNWSKFVRPGFVRVAASANPQAGVLVSAFRDPDGSRVTIVAVNASPASLRQEFFFSSGGAPESLVPWITSEARALEAQGSVSVVAGAFSYDLEPYSVTTFAGELKAAGDSGPAASDGGTAGAGGAAGSAALSTVFP